LATTAPACSEKAAHTASALSVAFSMQPIELVWARAKHTVATQSKVGRTHQESAQQMSTALEQLTTDTCRNLIAHTETLMSRWLATKEAGSLKRFGSLERLKSASAAQLRQCTDLASDDALIIGEEIRKEEKQSSGEN
jgi:ERCC4-type nuclease